MSERDDGPLYTLRPEGVRITVEPVAWMDVEEDGTRHGLRYWREGTHREVPLYVAPQPDHREAMRLALEAQPAPSAEWDRFHHVMHKHGLHPGRTDDDLIDLLDKALSEIKIASPPDHRVMDKPPEVKSEPLPEHPLDIGPRVWMTREAYRRDQEELASLREYARSTRDKLAEFRTMRENEWQIRRSVALSAGLNTEGPDDWEG
jgi:hypothetical protein